MARSHVSPRLEDPSSRIDRATAIVRSRFSRGGSNFFQRRQPATAQSARSSSVDLVPPQAPRMAFPKNLWGIALQGQAFPAPRHRETGASKGV
jgi:hypothetical protein